MWRGRPGESRDAKKAATRMIRGRYFPIADHPADIERFWAAARLLGTVNAPEWMGDDYRYLADRSHDSLAPADRAGYDAELKEFEAAGGVVDEIDGGYRLFVQRPWWDEVWSIAMYAGPSPLALRPSPGISMPAITRDDVTDVPAVFVADPFMLRAAETWHLFFEVMNWRSGRGEIALATSRDGVQWEYQRVVLAEPFHLSYPYVFRHDGDYYLVPESYEAGEVRLYRAVEFPLRWQPVATLLKGEYLVDPSVFRHDGRWWMFVDASPGRGHDTLRLFGAAELTGPWSEHPASPLIEHDAARARPAGRVTQFDGRIIRFAQNCGPAYGVQVRAFEVTDLTPRSYRERPVGPDPLLGASGSGWNASGMHHLDPHEIAPGRWIACVDGWRSTLQETTE